MVTNIDWRLHHDEVLFSITLGQYKTIQTNILLNKSTTISGYYDSCNTRSFYKILAKIIESYFLNRNSLLLPLGCILNDIQNCRCKTSRNGTLRRSVCRIEVPLTVSDWIGLARR